MPCICPVKSMDWAVLTLRKPGRGLLRLLKIRGPHDVGVIDKPRSRDSRRRS